MPIPNKAKNVFVIINQDKDKKTPLPKFLDEETLTKLGSFGEYYTILHDAFSKGEGEETIHRHLLLLGCDEKSGQTWIELLALIFDVPKNCIQFEESRNVKKCARYLVHRDNEFKYQFPYGDVQTNNEEQFKTYLLGGKVTAKVISDFVGNKKDFMDEFGPALAQRFWPMVEEMRLAKSEEGGISKEEYYVAQIDGLHTQLRDTLIKLKGLQKKAGLFMLEDLDNVMVRKSDVREWLVDLLDIIRWLENLQ